MSDLIKPDFQQCQALTYFPKSEFLFGRRFYCERCTNESEFLLEEKQTDENGLKGNMTVCNEHLELYKSKETQYINKVSIKPIPAEQPLPTKPKIDGGIINDKEGNPVAVIDNIPADNNKTWDTE